MHADDPELDRSLGALIGLAVGDALGAPAEGSERDSYPRIVDFAASSVHGIDAGEWTDDTAMAICLAESLLACGGLDRADLLGRFVRWHRHGENACAGRAAGISATTRATLEDFERTGRLDAARDHRNAGNGCIMRLAPVAILYRADADEARRVARAQALVTHTAASAVAATAEFAGLLVHGLRAGDRKLVARRPAAAKPREAISSAPRAVDTLEAALWCVGRARGFEEAVLEAVNLGGDTDTIGAVAGQLAGAIFGAAAIPERWRSGVCAAGRLADLAQRLHRAGSHKNSYDT
jgi:ADP-ribosyl-[dinitrogen reductase] hydrolase